MALNLLERFAPRLFFHPGETFFPITAEDYLTQVEVRSFADPNFRVEHPTSTILDGLRGREGLYLHFLGHDLIKGSPDDCVCYGRILPKTEDRSLTLIYFFLYSATAIYKICGCLPSDCCTKPWAHRADIKDLVIELEGEAPDELRISRVLFDAHGSQAGEWRKCNEFETDNEHPIAYVCKGDHSFYYDKGIHPRFFGVIWDQCGQHAVQPAAPRGIQIYDPAEAEYQASLDGWANFPGKMGDDGIDSPCNHGFWKGFFPKTSNNWFRRLFCPAFW